MNPAVAVGSMTTFRGRRINDPLILRPGGSMISQPVPERWEACSWPGSTLGSYKAELLQRYRQCHGLLACHLALRIVRCFLGQR
ncbi:hypothetical protein CYMTET_20212 [Cymbomonas tetramitiformis]|uniref:Uncharacterized protein n=1 Tax=Cymbomonas tetramitiformis TaxID=36881 RepID=A0AAE0G4Z0_9CHLO|nr:hypothetical protein CYMTET_20212 [Cymbomonas tetramitiformis]